MVPQEAKCNPLARPLSLMNHDAGRRRPRCSSLAHDSAGDFFISVCKSLATEAMEARLESVEAVVALISEVSQNMVVEERT